MQNEACGKRDGGFTLIEILAVILIIGILVAVLVPMVTDAIDAAQVTACQKRLGDVHQGIELYRTKYDRLPDGSGVRFLAQLYSRKAIESSKTNAERLTCPGVDVGALAIGHLPWQEWWTDPGAIDGSYSAYAGRDCRRYPLRRLSGLEPLVADDNDDRGMNHATTTNVLYGDGAVQTFELEILKEEGVLQPDADRLVVGPDSPVADMRKLSLD